MGKKPLPYELFEIGEDSDNCQVAAVKVIPKRQQKVGIYDDNALRLQCRFVSCGCIPSGMCR